MDYDELVQRPREWDRNDLPGSEYQDAADAIVQLQARVAELTAERDHFRDCISAKEVRALVDERDNWAALCAATGEDLRECKADLAAARALLRDCLPELDGEGVTIHRVWAALAEKDAP
jgi:hypothetical protein